MQQYLWVWTEMVACAVFAYATFTKLNSGLWVQW